MKISGLLLVGSFIANVIHAATYYVNANNGVPVPPYSTWSTAATNIQDAVNLTANGDTVLVTNGVYGYGGLAVAGTLTNRVVMTNAITVQSVNGPFVTTILGAGPTNGANAVRCAWLTNGASLTGFTVMWGATQTSGNANTLESGGGVWCASTNAFVRNCLIVSNQAYQLGSGIYQGTISGSLIYTNFGFDGAASYSVLNNCTVVSNGTYGVFYPVAMTNCIVYYNNSLSGNYELNGGVFSHCCTTPALSGTGNFTTAPGLFADGVHLATNSPCIGAGVTIAGGGMDIFGNAWSNPPSVGCAEWTPAPQVTTPKITLTGDPVEFNVSGFSFAGTPPLNFYWLENGLPLTDNGHFSGTQTTNLTALGVNFADAGNYQVVVSNAFGMVTSSVATLVVHCVDAAGINPVSPYSGWSTAATNIQSAITATSAGDVVLVTNGLYATGGISMDGVITNCVSVNKAILVQSVNGAGATTIQGTLDPVTTNGAGAVRCLWMTNGVIVSGFTIGNGATRPYSASSKLSDTYGGGVYGSSTNSMVCNCVIATNYAGVAGGGAYLATLINCRVMGNHSFTTGAATTTPGGGAEKCNLKGCLITGNSADEGSGGGADNCNLVNCALVGNASNNNGGAVNNGSLVNCTVTANTGYSSSFGAAVYGASLTNCIVIGNYSKSSNTNYMTSTLVYCCADPLPAGMSNVDVNPQFAADGYHLSQNSPCIGIGNSNVITGTDIDGQAWNNPSAIGCDEWHPQPVIGLQPAYQAGTPPHDLICTVAAAGQLPFGYSWSRNGSPISDDGHHSNSGTASLLINQFAPDDSGGYQVVVTNSFGAVTSAVVTVTIHGVNAAGANPVAPYTSWATAATDIQDAINSAAPGDIVLVTNGVYATGGMAMAGGLTNRVALNKVIAVMSANGAQSTTIQGAWDPISTNGPDAVRCAWLTNGAVLNGFTLQNGATLNTGDGGIGGPLQSGGGVWCPYTNAFILNCVLTNNSASMSGGGAAYGTIANSLIVGNVAQSGGGVVYSTLQNCTVLNNNAFLYPDGAGTRNALVQNCIVLNNYILPLQQENNYDHTSSSLYYYSCAYDYPSSSLNGSGDINASDAKFIDLYHLSTISPCYGTGNPAYTSGYDLDGQPWNNPPSMGCSEIVSSNLVGPLSVSVYSTWTYVFTNRSYPYGATINGRAASVSWTFGDGPVYTNYADQSSHKWTNSGDYLTAATVYNNDNPDGVSASLLVHVQQLMAAQIQPPVLLTNGLQIQFAAQTNASYTIQYTTNLSPASWQTLQTINFNQQGIIQIKDPAITNSARFYRIYAQ